MAPFYQTNWLTLKMKKLGGTFGSSILKEMEEQKSLIEMTEETTNIVKIKDVRLKTQKIRVKAFVKKTDVQKMRLLRKRFCKEKRF